MTKNKELYDILSELCTLNQKKNGWGDYRYDTDDLIKDAIVKINQLSPTEWQIIDEIGWGTKSTDYNKLREELKMRYPDKIEQVKIFVHLKQKKLMEELDKFADENGDRRTYWEMGDDSFSDLTAHIVGLGKDKYNEVMKKPLIAKTIKYKESFLYVFHP